MLYKMFEEPAQCHKCGTWYEFDDGECPKCETKPDGSEYDNGDAAVEDYIDERRNA